MSRKRAADDFEAIRNRLRELQRERRSPQTAAAAAGPSASKGAHRGPCACGLALFPDECDGSCKAL